MQALICFQSNDSGTPFDECGEPSEGVRSIDKTRGVQTLGLELGESVVEAFSFPLQFLNAAWKGAKGIPC